MPDQLGQRVEEIVSADDHFMVLGADFFGDLAGVGELAESSAHDSRRRRF